MYHFFVEQRNITEKEIILEGGDVNHIGNVLRMKRGEKLLLSSGDNMDYLCEIEEITESQVRTRILEAQEKSHELPCKIVLFQGLPKADKMELIIQKCVELGVYQIIPVAMKRCVVRLDDKKSDSRVKRWNAISESAAKQSKRSIIPEVKPVMSYSEAVSYAAGLDMVLLPYECADGMAHTRQVISQIKDKMSVGIFIGPEGGYDLGELELGKKAGFQVITLGPRILRTETAGMMLLSVIGFHMEP